MKDNRRTKSSKRGDYFFLLVFIFIALFQGYIVYYDIFLNHNFQLLNFFLLAVFVYQVYSCHRTIKTDNEYDNQKTILLAEEAKILEELKAQNLIGIYISSAEEALSEIRYDLKKKNASNPIETEVNKE